LCFDDAPAFGGAWLVAISLLLVGDGAHGVVACEKLDSTEKIFARHNASFLYYGYPRITGEHTHRGWIIHGVSLDERYPMPETAILFLRDLAGADIGSTVAFEIHDGYFYALSNQLRFQDEEVDWTSFYYCLRFPLDSPRNSVVATHDRLYRRQHAEGPIHDRWLDLGLQVDECTGELMIVESRREWKDGGSFHSRTFYHRQLEFDTSAPSSPGVSLTAAAEITASEEQVQSAGSTLSTTSSARAPSLPMDDLYFTTLTSSNDPHYAPTQERPTPHPEYGFENDSAATYILARTKLRSYNLASSTFLDLVEDSTCCNDVTSCLRLRIGSRGPRPLDDDIERFRAKTMEPLTLLQAEAVAMKMEYWYQPIRMWPPSKASQAHATMNPHLRASSKGPAVPCEVVGIADERSLVYLVRSKGTGTGQRGFIVLVSFDPAINYEAYSGIPLGEWDGAMAGHKRVDSADSWKDGSL